MSQLTSICSVESDPPISSVTPRKCWSRP